MNYQKAIFLINDGVRAAKVSYAPSRETVTTREGRETRDDIASVLFKTLDPEIKKGDLVVVPTNTRYKMTVAKVCDIDVDPELDAPGSCRWIVQRVDAADFDLVQEQEADAMAKIRSAEDRRKRKALREALEEDAAASLKALPIYSIGPKDVRAE